MEAARIFITRRRVRKLISIEYVDQQDTHERRYIVTHLSKIVYFPMIIVCKVLTAAHKLAVNKEGVN